MNHEFSGSDPYLEAARANVLKRVRRRRVVPLAIAGAFLVVAISATGAALKVQQISPQAAQNSVTCYAHDDLNSLHGTDGGVPIETSRSGVTSTPPAPNKVDLCALVWKGGLAQAAANGGHWPHVDPNTSKLPVPRLAYCVLTDGMTGGFPVEAPATTTAEVCDNLGLAVDYSVK